MGALTGAGTLIPFWRIPRGPLMTVCGTTAGVAVAAGLILVRDRTEREASVQGRSLPQAGAVQRLGAPILTGVAAGTLTAGVLWLSSVTDEISEKVVALLGARRPRVTLAVISAVSTAVLEYADSRPGSRSDPRSGREAGGEPQTRTRGVESAAKH
ncbi:MAG: hypothetical protein MOP51_2032 [Citricoccus sp.]|nr:hypothetical protein [Citricoccus sp. WCRC_4]